MKHMEAQVREQLTKEAVKLYMVKGWTIRQVANKLGQSYGWTHNALHYAGVDFRPRGGNVRGRN